MMEGKTVLVTGAARGIGKAIAERFLQKQADVVFLDKDKDLLRQTIAEQPLNSQLAIARVCDITDEAQVKTAVQSIWEEMGKIDVLINNAGLARREDFLDIDLANWDQIMNVNLRGTFVISQLVAKKMLQHQQRGSIVNITSKNGLAGSGKLSHYNTSKAGVHMLTQSMAVELAAHGIRVNAVAPGFIDTPLDQSLKQQEQIDDVTRHTPMKRMGTCQEVANGVYFLASDDASYITGTTLVIDGGHLANASEF
ncbi:SDR family NAD(P)-dependent oxidoreductase [Gracilibacillus alcaliphilus]|uniref:SDR family NAD(P)-dependent oxidoreductase n=1 Tax=Gracilibacillus alcaliphilus TaxID=1401441 RepID=UPI00195C2A0F|nr:SDR family NAD(P)-dependent oxidoreductase [Gracilibacillus alcaliphilus]MBM7679021.1 NAD(P)-dependent dehydrogenase (short-subunit alcohol dehydrogenase family) [Gracilibacillus alcaliphilus]